MRFRGLGYALPALVAAACLPASERSGPAPLKETPRIESLRLRGKVALAYLVEDPTWSRTAVRDQLSRWAHAELFENGAGVMGGRFVNVTMRSSELAGPENAPVSRGEVTYAPVDVLVRGPAPLRNAQGTLPRSFRVDTTGGCLAGCAPPLSELTIETATEPAPLGSLESLAQDGSLTVDVFCIGNGYTGTNAHDLGLSVSEILQGWGFRIDAEATTGFQWKRELSRVAPIPGGERSERVRIFDHNEPYQPGQTPPAPAPEAPPEGPFAVEIDEALRTRDVVIIHSPVPTVELASAPLAPAMDQLVFIDCMDPLGKAQDLRSNPSLGPGKTVWFVGVSRIPENRLEITQLLGVLMGPNRTVGDPRALEDGMMWDVIDPSFYVLHRFTGGGGQAP